MKHEFQTTGIADLIQQAKLDQVQTQGGPKQVAKSRIGIIEEYKDRQSKSSFNIEAWGDAAVALAQIPQGHTIWFRGKPQNYEYSDKQGNKKWGVKLVLYSVIDAGPSQYGAEQHEHKSQGAYGSQPQARPSFQGSRPVQPAPSSSSSWSNQNFNDQDLPF